jgi:hypothetical protein
VPVHSSSRCQRISKFSIIPWFSFVWFCRYILAEIFNCTTLPHQHTGLTKKTGICRRALCLHADPRSRTLNPRPPLLPLPLPPSPLPLPLPLLRRIPLPLLGWIAWRSWCACAGMLCVCVCVCVCVLLIPMVCVCVFVCVCVLLIPMLCLYVCVCVHYLCWYLCDIYVYI